MSTFDFVTLLFGFFVRKRFVSNILEAMEKAKNVHRAAKGNFTRTLNAGNMLIEAKRPVQEVREAFAEVKAAHNDLVAKKPKF